MFTNHSTLNNQRKGLITELKLCGLIVIRDLGSGMPLRVFLLATVVSPGSALLGAVQASRRRSTSPLCVARSTDVQPGENLYIILGISSSATDKEIRIAFRREARRLHPDLNPSKYAQKRATRHECERCMRPIGRVGVV